MTQKILYQLALWSLKQELFQFYVTALQDPN